MPHAIPTSAEFWRSLAKRLCKIAVTSSAHGRGRVEAIAEATGLKLGTLHAWTAQTEGKRDRLPRLDDALRVLAVTTPKARDAALVEMLRPLGYVAIPIPGEPPAAGVQDVVHAFMSTTSRVGEFGGLLRRVSDEGSEGGAALTPDEARQLDELVREVLRAATAMATEVAAVARGAGT